ncbi:heme exporter protein CcmD [Porticoccus sp.]|uniref:heme exporter protein CcmD n=1 Tax=Porticoccus sp. TaxID=2024853 RepID=UPI003F696CD9
MSGHGPYVWSAYLISILIMIWLALSPLLRQAGVRQAVARELRRETARRDSLSTESRQ